MKLRVPKEFCGAQVASLWLSAAFRRQEIAAFVFALENFVSAMVPYTAGWQPALPSPSSKE
jgi:hypothetical protein